MKNANTLIQSKDTAEVDTCCICKTKTNIDLLFNAEPYAKGQCCINCNRTYVIPARCGISADSIWNDLGLQSSERIANLFDENDSFKGEFSYLVMIRFSNYDWGIIYPEDKQINDDTIRNGEGNIVAEYETSKGNVCVVGSLTKDNESAILKEFYVFFASEIKVQDTTSPQKRGGRR